MKANDLFPDEKLIEAQKEAADKKRVQDFKEKDEWKFLLSDERGHRFIYRLMKECGVWDSSFKTSSEIYFLEGKRSIGLKVHGELENMGVEYLMKIMKIKKEIENAR